MADKGVAVRKSVNELFDAVIEHLDALGREPTTLLSCRSIGGRAGERFGKEPVGKLRASDLDRSYAELLMSFGDDDRWSSYRLGHLQPRPEPVQRFRPIAACRSLIRRYRRRGNHSDCG